MKQHIYHVLLILPLFVLSVSSLPAQESGEKPIPVIYDTDIADDIDDLWGLVFALKSPELVVRRITGSIPSR